nr:immunoglobulin light chain junction region [Macaca mulatta]MOV62411.1 immunoglobulin light chain junction region [Macaca mulatta]MOV64985.1 immunoglobulin light chain junction region [Macaca mulatta]
CQQHNRYPVTF